MIVRPSVATDAPPPAAEFIRAAVEMTIDRTGS